MNSRTRPARRADMLVTTTTPEAHRPRPASDEAAEAAKAPVTETNADKAKAIAARIMEMMPRDDRALRRAVMSEVRRQKPKGVAPEDPNCWLTPEKFIRRVLRALNIPTFSIDVASPGEGLSYVPALRHLTKDHPEGCGLTQRWQGRYIWLNPPYDNLDEWTAKAEETVRNRDANMVVALLPSRTGRPWFEAHLAGRARVFFLRQRVRFFAEKGKVGDGPKFDAMLVVWGGTAKQIKALAEEFGVTPMTRFKEPLRLPEAEGRVIADDEEAVVPTTDDDEVPVERRVIDLFSGSGAVHAANERAGLKTVLANDFSWQKRESFRTNFPWVRLDPRPIQEIHAEHLPAAALLVASPPCVDHSSNGRGLGYEEGDRGVLAFQVVRIVRELRLLGRAPKVINVENVTGLLDHAGGRDFARLVHAFIGEGYRASAVVMDAQEFVAQSRERVFLTFVRADVEIPEHLVATRPTTRWHPMELRRAHAALSAGARRAWFWSKMPAPPRRTMLLSDVVEENGPDTAWLAEKYTTRALALMPAKEWAKVEEARKKGIRVGVIKQRYQGKQEGRRLHHHEVFFDGRARCLLKNEGHECQRLIFIEEDGTLRIRDFTARERARLTALPEDYALPGKVRSRELAGDAVVVDVQAWLAFQLLRPLAEAGLKAPVQAATEGGGEGEMEAVPVPATSPMGYAVVNPKGGFPSTQVCRRAEVQFLPEALRAIEEHAGEEGVSVAELIRRAVDFYRETQGKAAVPKYVQPPRNRKFLPDLAGAKPSKRRTRGARAAVGGAKGEVEGISARLRSGSAAWRLPPRRRAEATLRAALHPRSHCGISLRCATPAAKGGWPMTWHAGRGAAASSSSRSQGVRPSPSAASWGARWSGPCSSSGIPAWRHSGRP